MKRVLLGLLLVVAVVLQTSFFSHFAWRGVVPNLAMLVVVGVALTRGARTGALVGFAAGLMLDLAPPADHVAGRWALALVLVGWVAGRVRTEGRINPTLALGTVAVGSLLASSVFALSGLLVDNLDFSVPDLLAVLAISLAWDLVAALVVLPGVLRLTGAPDARPRSGFARGPRGRTAHTPTERMTERMTDR